MLSEVWSSLRVSNQAGHPKRAALDTLDGSGSQLKRRKMEGASTGSNCIVQSPNIFEHQSSPVVGQVPIHKRKCAKARRSHLIVPSRLKDWLISADSPAALPTQDQAEGCNSVLTIPTGSKKRRTRRKKLRDSSTPVPTPVPESPEVQASSKNTRRRKKTKIAVDSKQRTLPSFINGNFPDLKPT